MIKRLSFTRWMIFLWFMALITLISVAGYWQAYARTTPFIRIGTTYTEIPWDEANTFGVVRDLSISDIIITETQYGTLRRGATIWLGVEGGVSRGWGEADHISLNAGVVSIVGCDVMEVSTPQLDSHGISIRVTRPSRNPGAQIIFSDVAISGVVFPGQFYNVIIAGDGIADNWGGFNWHRNDRQRRVHGFFDSEPFAIRAFSFVDANNILSEVYDMVETDDAETCDEAVDCIY